MNVSQQLRDAINRAHAACAMMDLVSTEDLALSTRARSASFSEGLSRQSSSSTRSPPPPVYSSPLPSRAGRLSNALPETAELALSIDGLVQSSRALGAAVEGARAEGIILDAPVVEAASALLSAAVKAADVSALHTSAVNPGAALEAAITVASGLGVDVSGADTTLSHCFFRRLSPSYTQTGGARNALTRSNDVLDLPELTPPTLLASLRLRFEREVVYTHVGHVVVTVNPFKPTGCVGREVMSRYQRGRSHEGKVGWGGVGWELPPHVYGLVARVHRLVLGGGEGGEGGAADQSVIISGESGAGKTEASKKVR